MDWNKFESILFQKLKKESNEKMKPWWDSLQKESDRAVAIIAACLIDTLLEELIRAFFVKERGVNDLFKDDHILKNLSAKIHVAYYSGLIPKIHYHDLKLICKIRNRFAHTLSSDLTFEDKTIVQLIQSCELRPKTMDDVSAQKIKYILIVQQIADALHFITSVLLKVGPSKLVDFYKLNEWHWRKSTLTKSRIIEIIRKQIKDIQSKE